jgi:hypothetical protein
MQNETDECRATSTPPIDGRSLSSRATIGVVTEVAMRFKGKTVVISSRGRSSTWMVA